MKINYEEINKAILKDRDIDERLVTKDERFYKYLFNNKVAYYYAKHLSTRSNDYEKWIIGRGDELNKKYEKTLSTLKIICEENKIPFLLFKTHKYIPEVVDGDIDIVVHEEDFDRFLKVFRDAGFDCVEDEPRKGKCLKEGLNVIEPHVTISWRGNNYIEPESLWRESIYLENECLTVDPTIDSLVKLMQVLYGPEYLTLHDLLHIQRYPYSNVSLSKSLNKLQSNAHDFSLNFKFPYFLSTGDYLVDWTKTLLIHKNLKTYLLHIVFFFYWKYRYKYFDILPFSHDWKIL